MPAQGALTIAIGVGAGLLDSAALTRFLATMLFEIAPTDAIVFCAVATLLAGVAVLACVAPAVRATCVDPLIGLRQWMMRNDKRAYHRLRRFERWPLLRDIRHERIAWRATEAQRRGYNRVDA